MAEDPENEAGLREIPASEILDKIQKGEPVEYDRVKIIGDLDIRTPNRKHDVMSFLINSDINKRALLKSLINGKIIITSLIKITNSQIEGDVYLCNTIFSNSINLNHTQLKGNFILMESIFLANANFNNVTFNKFANFYQTIFNDVSSFIATSFMETARFRMSKFFKAAEFGVTEFFSYAEFDYASFLGEANFEKANFNGITYFYDAVFSNYALFNYASFDNKVLFHNSKFGSFTSFSFSKFKGYTSFWQSEFKDSVFFKDTLFYGKTLLTESYFKKSFFEGTEFLEYFSFGKSSFKNITYDHKGLFRKAKKLLEEIGDEHEADDNFYLEMDARRRERLLLMPYIELVFMQWIFGYGVHPFRLFFIWLAIVFIFGQIYFFGQFIEGSTNIVECAYFSLISAATPGYGGYHLKNEFICQFIAGLEAVLGTFMWAAFITTFARKFSR